MRLWSGTAATLMMLAPAALLAALLAACQPDEAPGAVENAADTAQPPVPPEVPQPVAGEAEAVDEKTDAYEFAYSWPAPAGAIAPLAERLAQERDKQRAELKQEAEDWQKQAAQEGFNAPPYAFSKEWEVVTDLPRFLSLSAGIYTYSGGAHGMSYSDALVWDRQAAAAIKPVDMFLSEGSLDRAVQTRFCAELDRQRAKKRGAPVKRSDDSFSDCIAPVANSTVILGSASGQGFDRVGFLVPPYNAGPYAEGSYEVTLAVDAALIDAVKPEYQRFFTPGG